MSNGEYILDEQGNPVEAISVYQWGVWMQTADRRVGLDMIDGIKISTVFLGLDHNFGGGAPVLWETMVFGGELDGEQDRYESKDDAEAGHKAMCERVRAALEKGQG